MEVSWDKGIVIKTSETTLCLDPQTSKTSHRHILISHAHRDHTLGFMVNESMKYSTQPTADIFEILSKRKIGNLKRLSYGEKVRVGDVDVTAYDSGHVLGSAFFRIEALEGSIVYTGDLNCVDTLITLAANPIQCDILIVESTYGSPDLVFPPRVKVYKHIIEWVVKKLGEGKTPVFYVYPLGKAQELIKLLNEFTDVEVAVHPTIEKINKTYFNSNISLETTSNPTEMYGGKHVFIHPHYVFNYNAHVRDEAPAMATGWALRFKDRDGFFPLSSHADFHQLLNFVKNAKPKMVFTCFGSNRNLAYYIIQKLGINAKPLY